MDGSFAYSPTRVLLVTAATGVINIYPDPVLDGYMYINFGNDNLAKATIKITNATGQLIQQTDAIATTTQLKIMLPATKGAYYIDVITGDGKTVTKKVMQL